MSNNTASTGDKVGDGGHIMPKTDPNSKWKDYESTFPVEYSPSLLESKVLDTSGVKTYENSKSDWYFEKMLENPYISSTLYFYQSEFGKTDSKILPFAESNGKESGDKLVRIANCITRQPTFSVNNRFDQTVATPFSAFNTKMFRTVRQLASLDKTFGAFLGSQTGQITQLLTAFKDNQDVGSFFHTLSSNALNAITAFQKNLNYLNTVQFDSDAALSRSFVSSDIESPIHATFFFLQNTSDTKEATNRVQAYNLLKYLMPHQKLYTSWLGTTEGNEGALVDLNPEMKDIVESMKNSVSEIAEKIGAKTAYDTVTDLTSRIFDGGVITTMSPGGYMTSNKTALDMARKGLPDKRTFVLTTPWGMRMNLLPSNVQITESQSKVVVNGNKVLPMFIQVDVDFISSRRLLTDDVMSHVLNKYKTDFSPTTD